MRSGRFGRLALRVVVDSNVWVAGLIRPQGPPGRVVDAALHGRIEIVSSWELVEEVVDVLARPKLSRYELAGADIVDLLQALGATLPTVEVDVEIRDPKDAPVVAAAVAGRTDAIVTGDADLLDNSELHSWLGERTIRLLSPRELLDELPGPAR